MQNRDSIHEQAQKYNTSELWLAYRNARNNVVRLAKEEYYSDIIKENMHNSKSLWKSLKLLPPSKLKSVAKSFIINDVHENNPKSIATVLNDCFLSIGESLCKAFVGGEAFVFEHRVPTNISYNIPKVESSYVLRELNRVQYVTIWLCGKKRN